MILRSSTVCNTPGDLHVIPFQGSWQISQDSPSSKRIDQGRKNLFNCHLFYLIPIEFLISRNNDPYLGTAREREGCQFLAKICSHQTEEPHLFEQSDVTCILSLSPQSECPFPRQTLSIKPNQSSALGQMIFPLTTHRPVFFSCSMTLTSCFTCASESPVNVLPLYERRAQSSNSDLRRSRAPSTFSHCSTRRIISWSSGPPSDEFKYEGLTPLPLRGKAVRGPPRLVLVACAVVGPGRCALLGSKVVMLPTDRGEEGADKKEAIVAPARSLVDIWGCWDFADRVGPFAPFRGWVHCESFDSMISGMYNGQDLELQ